MFLIELDPAGSGGFQAAGQTLAIGLEQHGFAQVTTHALALMSGIYTQHKQVTSGDQAYQPAGHVPSD